jgi:phosphoribosylformimino-5-aminoimidazole carboxamide ribotide isomerase
MIIIPSIDLRQGQCVRLRQGDFNQTTIYTNSAVNMVTEFKKQGASALHIVDLDGAKNARPTQTSLIAEIINSFSGRVQVGGGVRTDDDIEILFYMGATQVVIGTQAIFDIQKTLSWIEKYGATKIVIALDFRYLENTPYLATHGWQTQTKKTLWEALSELPATAQILCTDISKDGMQKGPSFEVYQTCLSKFPALKLQASGGVSSLADIKKLKQQGLSACIIGKAFCENKLSLPEVLACLNKE